MSASADQIEREIREITRAARHLRTRSERERAAAKLHRLIKARPASASALFDALNERGGRRAYGRPECNPERISIERDMWAAKDRAHRRRRGFEAGIRSNGMKARAARS